MWDGPGMSPIRRHDPPACYPSARLPGRSGSRVQAGRRTVWPDPGLRRGEAHAEALGDAAVAAWLPDVATAARFFDSDGDVQRLGEGARHVSRRAFPTEHNVG